MNPIFHHLFQTTRRLNKQLNRTLNPFQLHASQWSVLYCVQKHEQMTLTDIWTYLNVEAPTVTRTVNRLVELDWLTVTHGDDRREKLVSLSERAIKQYPTVEQAIITFENEFLRNFTENDANQLMELLHQLDK
ncbi:MAG TPA: MarR family transcriptional regulator [Bacillota bacterium]|nr:MarR family transcriptional regulator [Bacillota bacterium]